MERCLLSSYLNARILGTLLTCLSTQTHPPNMRKTPR